MGHSTDKTSSSFSCIEKVVHYTVGGKEVVVDQAAGKDDKGKGKSQRLGSRHDICDAAREPTPPAPPQLPRLYVARIPPEITQEDLALYFGRYVINSEVIPTLYLGMRN